MPFRLASEMGVLSFISTTTVFGTPVDITRAELALETFFPADARTTDVLRQLVVHGKQGGPAGASHIPGG